MTRPIAVAIAALTTFLWATTAAAETRVTYKSAKSTSSYYQLAVQIAEAMKSGSDSKIIVTVEESQGSVQKVKEAANRKGNYMFTTPPSLVKLAVAGKKMFPRKIRPMTKSARCFLFLRSPRITW